MTTRNYFVALLVLSSGLLAAAAMRQEQAPPAESQTPPETTTIAGCLKAGESEGTLLLTTDDKQTYQVQAAEDLAAGSHVNHRVELSGTEERNDSSLVLKATSLKMLAASCEQ